MSEKATSPFTPGNPVPVELFVGRAKQVTEAMEYIKQSTNGRQENIFLVGERGIGKTSISSFLRMWSQIDQNILSVHVFLGGVTTLEEMVRRIFEAVLKASQGETWFDKTKKLFGNFISEVGLFGVTIGFAPPKDNLYQLVRNFPQAVDTLITKISEEKKGLFIILDDLDVLSNTSEFANWYKSFADQIATSYSKFPLTMMMVGLPSMMDSLSNFQPSLMRIFRIIELENLNDDEVSDFFEKAFKKVNVPIEKEALDSLVMFSSGLPIIMQELGDATFWYDSDNIIDQKDAVGGVLMGAERIGKKYLDPQVYRALRSVKYHSILRKLAQRESPLNRSFSRKDISPKLSESEAKVLDNFLRRLREQGIIQPDTEKERGVYRFVNDMYPVYFWLEASAYEKQKK